MKKKSLWSIGFWTISGIFKKLWTYSDEVFWVDCSCDKEVTLEFCNASRMISIPVGGKKVWRYVQSVRHNTWTDRRTERQTDRNAILVSCVSMMHDNSWENVLFRPSALYVDTSSVEKYLCWWSFWRFLFYERSKVAESHLLEVLLLTHCYGNVLPVIERIYHYL